MPDDFRTDDSYGGIASTLLIIVFFIVAAIWAKRAQKKGRFQALQSEDEVDEWLRQDQEWHRWQDEHRRFWSNH